MPQSRTRRRRRRLPSAPAPVGSLAAYGPDNTRATKLVAAVIRDTDDDDRIETHVWRSDETDVRHDPAIAAEARAWLASHGVRKTAATERIIGCPHEGDRACAPG